MSNKMLIDASHPEETRVAVVRGNRIEEFDFESQEKKQLRGNIYLAKVTRVEPSLQAAFIDYGGNRHGFLAFSEIHPDYYQIPVADRQALLEAEAAEARAAREADDADDAEEVEADSDSEDEEAAPKKKPRRRRSRTVKAADTDAAESDTSDSVEDGSKEEAENSSESGAEPEAEEPVSAAEDEATAEAEEKPKKKTTRRRTTRRKTAKSEEEAEEAKTDSDDDGIDEDGSPTTMAAMVETDSISESLPEEGGEEDSGSDDSGEVEAEPEAAAEEKPKRRKTSRTRRKPKASEEDEAEDAPQDSESTDYDAKDGTSAEIADADAIEETSSEDAQEAEKTPKPKRTRSRRRSSRKKDDTTDNDNDSDDANGDTVESVGQEDALEEVPAPRRMRRHYKIQEVIKRRQVLLVQVVKEERGTKGAALTTYLSLAGRYSVLMPNTARGGGISRKITNAADRKRLKSIAAELEVPDGMGVILRTAGAARTNEEITRDFEYLMRLWEQVRNLTLSSSAPCLVYEEGSLIKRSIRDLYDKDTGEIVVSGEEGFKEAKDFMTMLMPSHAKKVKIHKGSQSIFAKFGIETQLDKMVSPQVTLKSGGYLIINQTEALVAVDVNSGRATREHSVEDTALSTNLEAAEEVARQLRLRDLAGLIVIDFIDMEERRNNRSVEKKLKECLKNDRARIQVGRISHFGLMEMSRQRMRASVLESTMDVCSLCAGTGYVRSDSAIALHVFRAIEEHVGKHHRFDCVVKTTPAIAIHILNHKRASLLELEAKFGLRVIIEGDTDIGGQDFVIEKGDPARGEKSPAAVGFQNEAALEAVDGVSEDEDKPEDGKKKRGRKRRRKGQDDAKGTDAEVAAEAESSTDDDGEEGQPKKKRRRGKRGGRKNAEAETGTEAEAASGATSDDAETAPATGESKPSEPEASDVSGSAAEADDADEAKPNRRSTRRKKAPIAPKTEPASETPKSVEADDDADASPEEPPRKPRRRTTRRVSEKVVAEEVAGISDDSVSAEAPASESQESDEGKKKSGWWSRGGGFF